MPTTTNPSGPAFFVVFLCFAVALTFLNTGLGLLNLADKPSDDHRNGDLVPAALKAARETAERSQAEAEAEAEIELQDTEKDHEKEAKVLHGKLKETVDNFTIAEAEARSREQAVESERKRVQSLSSELAKIRLDIEARQRQQPSSQALPSNLDQAQKQVALLRQSVAEVRGQLPLLQQQIAESRSIPISGFSGNKVRPTVILECNGAGVIVVSPRMAVPFFRLDSDTAFINAIRNADVAILIRPSGFHRLDQILKATERAGSRTLGYEPIDENWQLRYVEGLPTERTSR